MNSRFPATIILFIVFLSLLSYRIDSPWQYRHDDNGKWQSSVARTHLIKGLQATKGQDFFLSGSGKELRPYLHHPPLVGLYLAAVFDLTGRDSAVTARTATAFVHSLSFLMFVLILNIMFKHDRIAKIWALFVFAVSPMSVFFGKMPNHEVLSLFFLLSGCYSYLQCSRHERKNIIWMAAGCISWIAAGFSSWHALFVIASIALYILLIEKQKTFRFGMMTFICLVIVPMLVVLQMFWANGWKLPASQKTSMLHWMTASENRSYLRCVFIAFLYNGRYTGPLPVLFSGLWLLKLLYDLFKKTIIPPLSLFILSLGMGTFIYNLIFFRAVETHPYQQFYLLPFISISSAIFINHVYIKLSSTNKVYAVIFLSGSFLATSALSMLYLHVIYNHIIPVS